MPVLLWVLIAVAATAVAVAVSVAQAARARRALVARLDASAGLARAPITILRGEDEGWSTRVGRRLRRHAPAGWSGAGPGARLLVHAGFDGDFAPLYYVAARIAAAALLPLAASAAAPRNSPRTFVLSVAVALALGVIGPRALLDRLAARRRDRIRRSIPDSLDLLVVCVEAGVGLDSAIIRVARDMAVLHPELSAELFIANRTMNAGISREEAMHGLFERTGVDELRGLASSMVQSERLGTSIARVLRVYSESLRRKRKQSAERRAAEASIRMIIPLALFMLPALFALVLGPAAFALSRTMQGLSGP